MLPIADDRAGGWRRTLAHTAAWSLPCHSQMASSTATAWKPMTANTHAPRTTCPVGSRVRRPRRSQSTVRQSTATSSCRCRWTSMAILGLGVAMALSVAAAGRRRKSKARRAPCCCSPLPECRSCSRVCFSPHVRDETQRLLRSGGAGDGAWKLDGAPPSAHRKKAEQRDAGAKLRDSVAEEGHNFPEVPPLVPLAACAPCGTCT